MAVPALLKSRKFWVLILDTAVSIAGHFLIGEDAHFLIAALQPVFLAIIVGITIEDAAALKAGVHPKSK